MSDSSIDNALSRKQEALARAYGHMLLGHQFSTMTIGRGLYDGKFWKVYYTIIWASAPGNRFLDGDIITSFKEQRHLRRLEKNVNYDDIIKLIKEYM